jgi:CRISPR-associated protein Cas1
MTGPWRIVDLTGYEGPVFAKQGHLRPGNREAVPLADVVAVLTGARCQLHASLLERAAAYETPLVHCDWRGVPVAATYGWSGHTRAGARQRAQAELSVPRQKNAWMQLVRAKIKGQASVLQLLGRSGSADLLSLAGRVHSGDPANLEGQAARLYWPRLFPDDAFRRIPRSQSGPNAFLDYGYTILRGACLRAVVSAGLAPGIGIWHRRRDNPFALVDDVIEPFRPAVDAVAAELWRPGIQLGQDEKRRLAAVLDQPMDASGVTVGTAIDRLSQQLGRYVEGDVARLAPPSFEARYAAR